MSNNESDVNKDIHTGSIRISSSQEANEINCRADSAIASIGSYYFSQGKEIPSGAKKLIDHLDHIMCETG